MVYLVVAVLVAIVLLFLVLVSVALSRPSTFRIERAIDIKAPTQAAYEILSDFHRSESWSPWEHKDPDMKRTFGGSPSGKGATYEWDGDKNVGHGRQEIVQAIPNSKIVVQLDFFRPFKGENVVEFLIEPLHDGSRIRWIMHGPVNFIVRMLCLNLDKMIGKDFEAGPSKA